MIGGVGQHAAEGLLGAGLVTLDHQGPGLVDHPVGLGGEDGVDELADLRLGHRPHELPDRFAVAKGDHGGDALHPELLGELLVGVDVDLHQLERAAVLAGDLLERRAQDPAGSAPGGPEVDDDRDLVAALQHLDPEGLLIHVLDEGRHLEVSNTAGSPSIPGG